MIKIFVVDDDPDICLALHYWMSNRGYLVKTFEETKELFTRIKEENPRLILLDINLSGEDGRAVCRQIKHFAPQVIVILFSANPTALMNCEECLADDSFAKPFNLSLLEEKLQRFVCR